MLANFLVEQYGKKGMSVEELVRNQMAKMEANKRKNVTYDRAFEEVVADSMMTMLNSGNVVEALAEIKSRDLSLWGKIKEFVTDFIAKFKKAVKVYEKYTPDSNEGQIVAEMTDVIGKLEQLFAEGLSDASENYRRAGNKKTAAEDGKVMSERENVTSFVKDKYFDRQIDKYKELNPRGYITVGQIGKESALAKIGMPVGKMYFDVSKLQKALNNHDDHLTTDIVKELPSLFTDPIVITEYEVNSINVFGELFVEDSPVMVGVTISSNRNGSSSVAKLRTIHARRDAANIITDENVLYLNEDKKRTRTWFDKISNIDENSQNKQRSQSKNGNTVPLGGTKLGFIRMVSQKNADVNTSDENPHSDRNVQSISSSEYEKMTKHFGTTNNYEVAGYLLKNGKMLDFSGKHWGDDYSTSRQVDHRDIQEVLDGRGNNGVNAMIDMISNGNIRLMPETGGINLSSMPSNEQMSTLRGYINHFRGEIVVDIDAVGGDTIQSFAYSKGTSSSKILTDIKEYFQNGTVPQEQSGIREFLYSDRTDVVDINGKEYDHVIELDYKVFNKVKKRGKSYIDFIRNNLIKQKITVYDGNGDVEIIEFARSNERVKKDGTNNFRRVLGELERAKNETKKIVVLNSVETAKISQLTELKTNPADKSHQWLDANGWEHRKSYVMTNNGTIYPVVLFIAKTIDGRNILYDVNVKIEEGVAIDTIATSKRAKELAMQAVKFATPSEYESYHKSNDLSSDSNKKSFSDRSPDSVSNRSLLANALESAVTSEEERKNLASYKQELAAANELEGKLAEIRGKIKELSFAKGPKDKETLSKLKDEARKTVNRIDIRDKRLLRLEATKPLKALIEREKAKGTEIKYSDENPHSDRNYSYQALVSKPDMKVTVLSSNVPKYRADVIVEAKKNAAKIGKFNPKDASVSVHVDDVDTDVTLGKNGLKHGLDRRFDMNAPVVLRAGEIIKNSILINELIPQKEEAESSYVLMGAAQDSDGSLYIVQSVVNKFSNEVETIDVLYSVNAKKETAALNAPKVSTPRYRFKNRVTAAQFAPKEAIANTLRSPQFNDSIAQKMIFVKTYLHSFTVAAKIRFHLLKKEAFRLLFVYEYIPFAFI